MRRRRCIAAIMGVIFGYSCAEAQESNVRNPVYEIARNKIGLLRYCRDKGFIDRKAADEALRANEHSLGLLTSKMPYSQVAGDEAEKRGEAGVYGSGSRQPIVSLAHVLNTTPEALCKEWVEDSMMTSKAMRLRDVGPMDAPAPQ
jgi:hypothetical protein